MVWGRYLMLGYLDPLGKGRTKQSISPWPGTAAHASKTTNRCLVVAQRLQSAVWYIHGRKRGYHITTLGTRHGPDFWDMEHGPFDGLQIQKAALNLRGYS